VISARKMICRVRKESYRRSARRGANRRI